MPIGLLLLVLTFLAFCRTANTLHLPVFQSRRTHYNLEVPMHLFCAVIGFIKKNVNQLSNQICFSVEKNTKKPDFSNHLKIVNIHVPVTSEISKFLVLPEDHHWSRTPDDEFCA